MTALTNEIIGLVLVVAVIVVVLVVRHLLVATRRTQGPRSDPTRSSDTPRTRARPVESPSFVSPAFGPAPVWAGGSPVDSSADRGYAGEQMPPELLQASAPHPGSNAPTMFPPPLNTAQRGQERDSPQETVVVDGTGDESPCVEVVAVPGNSEHASRVMHVSSLRAAVAREIPTTWMVVTPMDLLGEEPPEVPPAPISASVAAQSTEPVSEPTVPPAVEQPESPSDEEVILVTPNPFGPSKARSSRVDLGMPSSLLADLLGSETPVGE